MCTAMSMFNNRELCHAIYTYDFLYIRQPVYFDQKVKWISNID